MRSFLATLAGIISGVFSIKLFEAIGQKFMPVKVALDPNNLAEIKQFMFKLPVKVLITIILAHVLGLLTGMLVVRLIEKSTRTPLFIVSGMILLLSVLNLLYLPHPLWFVLADLGLLMIVSFAYIQTRKIS